MSAEPRRGGERASTVDVVVVTHNTRELVLDCARSILDPAAAPGLDVRLTVVDNASEDGTAEALAEHVPAARVIRNEHNAGYGTACNQGLAGGDGRHVLILNSDTVVRPGAIARLAEFLDESPEHVAAGARLVDRGTDDVQVGHCVRGFPSLSRQLAQMVGAERKWPRNPVSRPYLCLDFDFERTQDADQPAGSCLFIRREVFDRLGGFDEGFFYWYEDVDLLRRLHGEGRVAYVHDAVVEHVGSATFVSWSKGELMQSWYPSLLRYFRKHHPRRQQLVLRAATVASMLIRSAAALPRDRDRARAFRRVGRMALRGD